MGQQQNHNSMCLLVVASFTVFLDVSSAIKQETFRVTGLGSASMLPGRKVHCTLSRVYFLFRVCVELAVPDTTIKVLDDRKSKVVAESGRMERELNLLRNVLQTERWNVSKTKARLHRR